MYDINELADMLSEYINETGKERWSAKDIKQYFLSEGINLSLDEIMHVWEACPNPVCACELLGCDQAVMADDDIIADDDAVSYDNFDDFYEACWEVVCDRFYASGYKNAYIEQNTQGCSGSTDFYENGTLLYRIDERSASDAACEVYDEGGTIYDAADAIEECITWRN